MLNVKCFYDKNLFRFLNNYVFLHAYICDDNEI